MSSSPIELWFVRHGESKNNAIMNAAGGLGTILYPVKFSQDPYITEKGITVAQNNGARLVAAKAEFDLVFCSSMIRTMETSYYMFIKTGVIDKVYVAPFISELPLTFAKIPIYENMPLERTEQIEKLGKNHGSELLDKIDWSLVGGPRGNNEETLPPSGENFLKWLHELPLVKDLLLKKEKIRIGVVTHSHFLMEKDTLGLDKKPDNADIWTANLHVMKTANGPPLLNLTDLQGWYREEIQIERELIDKKLEKKEKKLEKKTEKYEHKMSALQASSSSGGNDESDEEKKEKKMNKLLHKVEKMQNKIHEKIENLQERKAGMVNIADLQIAEQNKV